MARLRQVDHGQPPVTKCNAYRRICPGPVVVGTTVDEAISHRPRQFMELFDGPPTRWVDKPCKPCRGAGKTQSTQEIDIHVPRGVEEGVQLRIGGEGDAGDPGAPRGDLYCVIHEQEHPIFQRHGSDLIAEFPFSFTQLPLGDKVEVPTLTGRVEMTIPAGTQSGNIFRLRGQGLPAMEGGRTGDQLVRVFIETPSRVTSRQKEWLDEFAAIEDENSGNQSFFEKITGIFN